MSPKLCFDNEITRENGGSPKLRWARDLGLVLALEDGEPVVT